MGDVKRSERQTKKSLWYTSCFAKNLHSHPPETKKHRHHFLSYFWKGRLFGAKLYTFLVVCCPNSDTKRSRWLWHNQSSHGSRLQFQRWCRRLGGHFDHLIFAMGFLAKWNQGPWLLKKMHRNVPRHIYLLRFFSCLVDISLGSYCHIQPHFRCLDWDVWIFWVQKNCTVQQNHGSGIPSFQETQGLAKKIPENGVFLVNRRHSLHNSKGQLPSLKVGITQKKALGWTTNLNWCRISEPSTVAPEKWMVGILVSFCGPAYGRAVRFREGNS